MRMDAAEMNEGPVYRALMLCAERIPDRSAAVGASPCGDQDARQALERGQNATHL